MISITIEKMPVCKYMCIQNFTIFSLKPFINHFWLILITIQPFHLHTGVFTWENVYLSIEIKWKIVEYKHSKCFGSDKKWRQQFFTEISISS